MLSSIEALLSVLSVLNQSVMINNPAVKPVIEACLHFVVQAF
jgi:hypothetical protein